MTSDSDSDSDSQVVAALRYDEAAVATELAAWCGGELEPDPVAGARPTIWVPSEQGPRPASFGDWIVRRGWGDYYPCTPQDFAARHEPLN